LILYRLARYLNWLQHRTQIFNVGNRRRLACQAEVEHDQPVNQSAAFFDPENPQWTAKREELAMDTLEELLHWLLYENGSVGILGMRTNGISRGVEKLNWFRCNEFDAVEKEDDS
jgi:6-phosphofructo-2-kinase